MANLFKISAGGRHCCILRVPIMLAFFICVVHAQQNTIAITSAASYQKDGAIAPESIASAFGTKLAPTTEVASTATLPAILAGTSVTVTDAQRVERTAPLFFVSPGQVNFLVPPETSDGAATVTVRSSGGATATGSVRVARVAPGLFSADASGKGLAAALVLRVASDGSQTTSPVFRYDQERKAFEPALIDTCGADDQVFLILFGTGFRNRTALADVTAQTNYIDIPVAFAGPQGYYVGLDQINLGPLPRRVFDSGGGERRLVLTVKGQSANQVTVSVRVDPSAPVISNFSVTQTSDGNTSYKFDFTDIDGDLIRGDKGGNIVASAVNSSFQMCAHVVPRASLPDPTARSGTIQVSTVLRGGYVLGPGVSVGISVSDALGLWSNTATTRLDQNYRCY